MIRPVQGFIDSNETLATFWFGDNKFTPVNWDSKCEALSC